MLTHSAMNTRTVLLVAAGLVVSGIVVGCGSTISDDGETQPDPEDCGPLPAEPGCGEQWECMDGEWVRFDNIQPDFCVPCPEVAPANGSACDAIGMQCAYDEEYGCDEGPTTFTAECTDEGWLILYPRCLPEPICPEDKPTVGTDCTGWDEAYYCSYDVACDELGNVGMHCELGGEMPTWVLDSGSETCSQTACAAASTAADCAGFDGCQWLEPGCATEEQQAITAGCYPTQDCLVTDACGPEEICSAYVYNPCFEQPCDACGGEYSVCTPAELGGSR